VAELVSPGGDIIEATATTVDSFNQMTAEFDTGAAAEGLYTVRIRNGEGQVAELIGGFEIIEPGFSQLETRLIMPARFGRHAVATIYVEYANTGNASMPAPLLSVQSADPDGSDRPILTLDDSRIIQDFWSAGLPPGTATEVFILASGEQAGVLHPGERKRVPVHFIGLLQPWDFSDTQTELEIRYWTQEDTIPIDWTARKEALRPPTLDGAIWDIVFENLTSGIGTTAEYIRMLNENASYLGRLGQRVVDVDALWQFELQQAYGYSAQPVLDSSTDLDIAVPGLSLDLSRQFSSNLSSRNHRGIFGQGWYTPWEASLLIENAGAVLRLVGEGGTSRLFTRDTRNGSYFSGAGDSSKMEAVGGVYHLVDSNGIRSTFDAAGRIESVEDPNGNRIELSHEDGKISRLEHSSGASISVNYNGSGFVSKATGSTGHTTAYTYDGTGHLESVTTDDGKVIRYAYEVAGTDALRHTLVSIERAGLTRTFSYDGRGRLVGGRLADGEEAVDYGYDGAGGVRVTDGQGTTNLSFDHRGLLVKVRDPLGNTTVSEYGDDLRLSRVLYPSGESQLFDWCACGSPTLLVDELGNNTVAHHFDIGLRFQIDVG